MSTPKSTPKATPSKAKATSSKGSKDTLSKAQATPSKGKGTPAKAKETPVKAKDTPSKAASTSAKDTPKATPSSTKVAAATTPSKSAATPSKSPATKPSKSKAPTPKTPVVEDDDEELAEEDSDEEEDDSEGEDGGVDEEGLERLVKALGDNGLDEFELAQLEAMAGGSDSEGEGDDDDEAGEGMEVDEEEDSDEEAANDENEDEDEEDDAIALDDVESLDGDAVPQQKLEIDNHAALARIRETIQLDPAMPWTEKLVVTYPESITVDVNDDLNRELAFYKQALHSANAAKKLATKAKLPFTRPDDYFAEMVKSDSHMERIRQRLLDETAGIKKSEEKRKEREGKKFGKQVQQEKLKERQQAKKDMEERLQGLKRKRKDMLDKPEGGEDFDVAVEDAIADRPSKRAKGGPGGSRDNKLPRQARDKKFGFGGAGRRSKSNDKSSTDDFNPHSKKGSFRSGGGGRPGAKSGGSGGGGKAGGRHSSKRLGKSKRQARK